MTLILSCMTQKNVVQVSDRRLTFVTGSHERKLADDNSNKVVVFCGSMAFAYTGLATLSENEKTDVWLTETLLKVTRDQLSDACHFISEAATDRFKRINLPAEYKLHTFVGIGWVRVPQQESLRPIICQITNAKNERGELLAKAREEFFVRYIYLQQQDVFYLNVAGQPLNTGELSDVRRNLLSCISKKAGPGAFTQALVHAIRGVAAYNGTVGHNLLSISLPKTAAGIYHALSYPPKDDQPSFLYIPADCSDGVVYGPNYVCHGIAMRGITIEGF